MEQTPEPSAALNLPATQAVQGPPSGPVKPRLQVQSLCDVLLEGDVECAGQKLHGAEPDVSLNLPVAQTVQGPPSGPVEPVGHAVSPSPEALKAHTQQAMVASTPSSFVY